MKRVVVPELLDSDTGTAREVEDSLHDLQMVNRWFGGAQVMSDLLYQVAAQRRLESVSWLDVAGASGDIAGLAQKSLARKGVRLEPILLDRAATHLNGNYPSVCSDALALPFGNP